MIRVIFDASALAIYAAREPRSMSVGELIKVVSDDRGAVGVPATAYIDAYRAASSDARGVLEDLVTSVPTVIQLLPLAADDASMIAEMVDYISVDQAHSVVESLRYDAYVASFDPSQLDRFMDSNCLIALNDKADTN